MLLSMLSNDIERALVVFYLALLWTGQSMLFHRSLDISLWNFYRPTKLHVVLADVDLFVELSGVSDKNVALYPSRQLIYQRSTASCSRTHPIPPIRIDIMTKFVPSI